uniref:Uncharacterized protein n=1 Tax=Oryza meridionalis TaxID=40149 RepID=A0A0E0DSN1_9ORYZ
MDESGQFARIWPPERAGESSERSRHPRGERERERELAGDGDADACPAVTTTTCCCWCERRAPHRQEEGAAASAGVGDERGGDDDADACPATTTTTTCCGRGQLKRQIARTLSNLMVPGGGKQIAAGSEEGQAAAKAHGCFRLR